MTTTTTPPDAGDDAPATLPEILREWAAVECQSAGREGGMLRWQIQTLLDAAAALERLTGDVAHAWDRVDRGDARCRTFEADLDAARARAERAEAALREIAEEHDAGRHDGLPEPCPAYDADTMFGIARAALQPQPRSSRSRREVAMSEAWDGRPDNPERDGWHWLSSPYADTPEPVLWDADQQQWHYAGWCVPEYVCGRTTYLAPCSTPAEVAALVAAAERRGMERAEAALREIADHPTGGVGCNPENFVRLARAALQPQHEESKPRALLRRLPRSAPGRC